MYRVVIAEDEEDVRRIIKNHINESETEFQVIGEAGDGAEALECLKELKPDILLTDICMPNLNGLELIRKVKEIDEDLPVIIISGYDEFAYAKEAMSMGVREYLLKPFLPRDLFGVLEKTKKLIDHKKILVDNLTNMSEQLKQAEKHSMEWFVWQLLKGESIAERYEGNPSAEDFFNKKSWYCASVVRLGNLVEKEERQAIENYVNIIKDYYFSSEISVLEIIEQGQLVLIFAKQGKSSKMFWQEIKTGMERIALSMRQYHGIRMQCVIGQPYGTYDQIRASYQEALKVWRGVVSDEAVIMYQKNERGIQKKDEDLIVRIEKKLLLDIQTGNTKEAVEGIESIIDCYADFYIENVEYSSVALVKLVLNISDATEKAGGNIQAWNDMQIITYLKHHFTYGSLIEVKQVLVDYVKKCCQQFQKINTSHSDRLIEKIKIVIAQNLSNEEFGLEMLAEEIHFSANYIRQIFKSNTGKSFSSYLIEQRMELAKKLLDNPAYKIQEIAEKTGYSNQRYFTTCFKKYYKCTPTEYRDNLD